MRETISIGIDPGNVSGCLAVIHSSDMGTDVECLTLSKNTMKDIADKIREVGQYGEFNGVVVRAVIEKVNPMPGQGISSTGKFMKNYGTFLGILMAHGIPYKEETPTKWMRAYVPPIKGKITITSKEKKQMTKEELKEAKRKQQNHNNRLKKEHKRSLKEESQKLYPDIKITNDMSDAILIADYCKNHFDK